METGLKRDKLCALGIILSVCEPGSVTEINYAQYGGAGGIH